MPKFTPQQVEASLKKIKEWSLAGEAIQRTFQFPDFVMAMKFVDAIATIAETDQHHPDMLIRYNRVTVTLSTHDVGGISEKDFDAANKYEATKKRLIAAASTGAKTSAGDLAAGAASNAGSVSKGKREKTK